jgi:hypothetical protein
MARWFEGEKTESLGSVVSDEVPRIEDQRLYIFGSSIVPSTEALHDAGPTQSGALSRSDVRVSGCDDKLPGSLEGYLEALCPCGVAMSASMGGIFT